MSAPPNSDVCRIDVEACRARQSRMLELMQKQRLDLVIVTRIEHIQYLTGPRFGWMYSPIAALSAEGRMTLVAPSRKMPEVHAADDVRPYEAQLLSTLRNDQPLAASQVLFDALGGYAPPRRLGIELSSCGQHIAQHWEVELVDIEPGLYELRRRKNSDELCRLQRAIDATGAMYRRAREIVKPGVNELDVFSELQAVAVRELGEMLTGTGNDYACGVRGGPPRDRAIQAGELYILDLGPACRGYFADNARTLAVGGEPNKDQQRAWEQIVPVFKYIQETVRPGKSCRELFEEVKSMLDAAAPWQFNHHLGHGIGLFLHEAPHLNPHWDDTFQVGDVFACEPGLYHPDLRGGIRLEDDYLVTAGGVELLSDFPLEL